MQQKTTKQLAGELLLTDLQVAGTFIDLVLTSTDVDNQNRSRENALKVYRVVEHSLTTDKVEPSQREPIIIALAELKSRLKTVGVRVSPGCLTVSS